MTIFFGCGNSTVTLNVDPMQGGSRATLLLGVENCGKSTNTKQEMFLLVKEGGCLLQTRHPFCLPVFTL